jgi:transcription initiation factor TFIIIB Brf1 subunit/transcription initiation factor TFIIB
MSTLRRISVDEVFAAANTLWLDKSIAATIASSALQIINQTYTRRFEFFSGRSSKYLVGGLFFLLGYRYCAIKKQKELAHQLGTTEVTIRLSYRKWLETFPDLFLDVINKFAENKNFRVFVLLDLKQRLHQSGHESAFTLTAAL